MEDEHTGRSSQASHDVGTRKGEEMSSGDTEEGRETTGRNPAGRPTGTSGARTSTSINPDEEEANDPDSPNMPPA